MNKVSAVIFDMDGLMFDTEMLFFAVQTEIARKRGKTLSLETKSKMMGRKPLDAIKIMLKELELDDDFEKIIQERDEAYLKIFEIEAKPMPGLFECLNLLNKHNIRKAIASGSHHEWINTILKRFRIQNQFEVIVSSQDVEIAKPSPEIYQKAVSILNLEPQNCVVLEDSLNGIKAGKAAGCIAVAIPNIATKHCDFLEANYIVESLSDPKLKTILGI